MASYGENVTAARERDSTVFDVLIRRVKGMTEQVVNIHRRVDLLTDQIMGPTPTSIGDKNSGPAPIPHNLVAHIDDLSSEIESLSNALNRADSASL